MAVYGTPQLAGITPVLEETGRIAQEAITQATQATRDLQQQAARGQLSLAANQFARSKDPAIAALGGAARGFVQNENFEDAEVVLAVADTLERMNALGKGYRDQEWVGEYRSFAMQLDSQATGKSENNEKLDDQWRYVTYTYVQTGQENVANAARLENVRMLSRRKNPFVTSGVGAIVDLYANGQMEQADRALGYLLFYDKTYNRKNALEDGKKETRAAVQLAIEGKESEKMFQRGMESYSVAYTVTQLSRSLEKEYEKLKKATGESPELEKQLEGIQKDLAARRLDEAEGKIKQLEKTATAWVGQRQEEQLAQLEGILEAGQQAIDQMEEQLRKYAPVFSSETMQLLGALEKLRGMSEQTLTSVRKAKGKELASKEGEALQSQLDIYFKLQQSVFVQVPTALMLMNGIVAEEHFENVLHASRIDSNFKRVAKPHAARAQQHLRASLDALLKEGAASPAAQKEFRRAMKEKARVLTVLRLRDQSLSESIEGFLSKEDPIKQFQFFQAAAADMYDRMAQGEGMEPGVWKLSGALFNLESSIRQSEEKLFARGETELQDRILEDSKRVIAHYTGETRIAGVGRVDGIERRIQADAKELSDRIASAETKNEVVKIIGSFIHPSVLFAVTIDNIAREHAVTGKVSWASTGMLVASTLAFRHTGLMKGVLGGFERTAAGRVFTGMELALGGALMVHGGVNAYHAFREGNWKAGALTLAMFALPVAYGTVRTPLMHAAKRTYRELTGNRILKRMRQLETAGLPRGVKSPSAMELTASEAGRLALAKTEPPIFARTLTAPRRGGTLPGQVGPQTIRLAQEQQARAYAARLRARVGRKNVYMQFLKLKPGEQYETLISLRQAGEHEAATSLIELRSLRVLEQKLGVRTGELTDTYVETAGVVRGNNKLAGIVQAREAVLGKIQSKLGIEIKIDPTLHAEAKAHVFDNFFSLLSSNLLPTVRSMVPPALQGKITHISYHHGLVGAYRIRLQTSRGERTFFVKTHDGRADAFGAEAARIAGIPAPRIRSGIGEWPFEFVDSAGNKQVYSVSQDMRNFDGTLRIAGRDVEVNTATTESIATMTQNAALRRILQERPELVMEEIGYTTTGTMSVGMWDGHQDNLFAMLLRVSDSDAAFLRKQGYPLFRDSEGYMIFRIGRVDTDNGGAFQAVRRGREYDFTATHIRVGIWDMGLVFESLASQQNRPVQSLIMDQFQYILRGAERWHAEVGSRPEFSQRVAAHFRSHEGQPVGLGMKLTEAEIAIMERGGRPTKRNVPFNGHERTEVAFPDGRSRFVAQDAQDTFQAFRRATEGNGLGETWQSIKIEMIAGIESRAEARAARARRAAQGQRSASGE